MNNCKKYLICLMFREVGPKRGVVKKQTSFLEKYFSVSMSNHSRAPKTCFTLGLKLFEYISRGVLPFKLALLCWLFWPTMTKNNKGNLFVFEVGPSVKFVSAIKDAIFNKKMGVIFFCYGELNLRCDCLFTLF